MKRLFTCLIILFPIYVFSIQDNKMETLNLSWQSFIYTKQLDDAYELAKKVVKIYPQEIIWLERLAQVCVWTGRIEEAASVYEKIYRSNSNSPSLLSNLNILKNLKPELYLEISIQNLKKNFSENQLVDLIRFCIDYGEIEKATELADLYAEKVENKNIKEEISLFYLGVGKIDRAEKLFSHGSKNRICEFALEKAKFYFRLKHYSVASDILEKNPSCFKYKDYAFFFSDLMFFIGNFDKSAKISEVSISENFYRQKDAEHVYNYYLKRDKSKAAKIAASAYKKFNAKYFLYLYLSSEQDETAKKNFLRKEARNEKEFAMYDSEELHKNKKNSITNVEKIISEIKSAEDPLLASRYIWNIFHIPDKSFRKAIGEQLNCTGLSSDSLYLPVAYLKSSYGSYQDALNCFNMSSQKDTYNIQSLLQYSDFLRNAGFYTESDFYARKAYNLTLKKDKEKLTAEDLRLHLIFSNSVYFKKKIEQSDLTEREKLDLNMSYLLENDLRENLIHLANMNPQKTPDWTKFFSIYESKSNAENFEASGYSPPSRDMANLYIQQRKINVAKYEMSEALKNSPDEIKNHILWRSLFTRKSNENGLYYKIEDKSFAQSVSEGAKFTIVNTEKMTIGVHGENEKMTFFSGHGFSKKEGNYSMVSAFLDGQTWNMKISRRKRIENFNSFYIQKSLELKKSYIYLSLGINEESNDTFALENAGKSYFFSQEILKRFSSRLSAGIKNSIYNYKDQQGYYAGKAYIEEIYLFWPKIGLRPYAKIGNYDKANLPVNSSLASLYNYQNPAMLPKSFSEIGLGAYFFKDKVYDYNSRWAYPLSISLSYNSTTFFNYAAHLNIKTPGIYRKDATLSITYSQGASTENNTLLSCNLFVNFR